MFLNLFALIFIFLFFFWGAALCFSLLSVFSVWVVVGVAMSVKLPSKLTKHQKLTFFSKEKKCPFFFFPLFSFFFLLFIVLQISLEKKKKPWFCRVLLMSRLCTHMQPHCCLGTTSRIQVLSPYSLTAAQILCFWPVLFFFFSIRLKTNGINMWVFIQLWAYLHLRSHCLIPWKCWVNVSPLWVAHFFW